MPWIDHRHTDACCACSRCGTFLFVPLLVIVLWPQISGKDSPTHTASNSRSPFLHLCTEKLSHLQQGRVTISSLPYTTSPFQSPYHGKAENDMSWDLSVQYNQTHHQTLRRLQCCFMVVDLQLNESWLLHNSVFDITNICSAVFTSANNRLHWFERQPFWFHNLNSMIPV